MAVIQRICAILCLFFVTQVASLELSFYKPIKHLSQDTFKKYDVTSITFMDFRGCQIEEISEIAFAKMTSLNYLMLAYNNIEFLPDYLFKDNENLDKLEFRTNQIEYIPKALFLNLRKLTNLNFEVNLISSVEPGTFDGNIKLKSISFKSNRLTVIPTGVFNMLKELEFLELSDNLIYKIEDSALPVSQSLRHLYAHSNKLSTFDEKYLKGVTHATLDKNPWHCDCHIKDVHAKWKANHATQGWSPVCDAPKKLHNVKFSNLQSDNFVCASSTE